MAPQAIPIKTLAILLSSSPNLGSFAAVLSTWENATQPGFPIFLRPTTVVLSSGAILAEFGW